MARFVVDCEDNDSYTFRDYPELPPSQRIHQELVPDMSGASRPGFRRCQTCRELLAKWDEPLSGLKLKKSRYDISATYDGVVVVSLRFKTICENAGLSGLTFQQLPNDPTFFAIRAKRAVAFDAERRKTRFINPCSKCGRFETVVGATPVFLKTGSRIGNREFVRTDLEFASGDEKHPLLLCGEVAAKSLSEAKLKGLDLCQIDESNID